jgi:hypothetical protein
MSTAPNNPLFASRPPERAPVNFVPWIIAGVVVLIVAVGLVMAGHRTAPAAAHVLEPLDPYAANLAFSQIQMSESTSLSGGKSTYIDGRLRNNGTKTVNGATVQVLFANDTAMPPQIETVPLSIIRTHEPYIDTEPISAAPLAPGDEREFRLVFEGISPNWNQQLPEIHATHITTR